MLQSSREPEKAIDRCISVFLTLIHKNYLKIERKTVFLAMDRGSLLGKLFWPQPVRPNNE